MNRTSALALVAVLGAALPAAAQPGAAPAPAPAIDPATAQMIEKRVPEELATEGVVLGRNNLSLQVQAAGAQLLVSLIDTTTGRVAASTKIDELPADREAAVAMVTHVAADLVTEIAGRPPAPPAPAQAPQVVGLVDDRAERAEAARNELRFQRQAIRFGSTYDFTVHRTGDVVTASAHRRWITFQGDLDQSLDPEAFYKEVGRPDLIDEYNRRHDYMIGGYVVGALGIVAGGVMIFKAFRGPADCDVNSGFSQCIDDSFAAADRARDRWLPPALIALGIGAAGGIFGAYYQWHPHPISENEAKSLADAYNQGLRKQLGLPVADGPRVPVYDVTLAPTVVGGGGGVGLSARF